MQISVLHPADAATLVPLNLQVQAVHSAAQPDRYVTDPDPGALAAFLGGWLADPCVTALVAGPPNAPTGYLIYEILDRPETVLRKAECRAVLLHICVDKAHRRNGIGRALIAAFRSRADVRAAATLWTSYAAFSTASDGLMRAMGFAPSVIFAEAPMPQEAQEARS